MSATNEAYLDNNATTPLLPDVREAMVTALDQHFANPSSKHRPGAISRRILEEARRTISLFIGAMRPSDVLFTSSATEAITQAFKSGCVVARQVAVSTSEHTAVLDAAGECEASGLVRIDIPVSRNGEPLLDGLANELSKRKTLVSLTLVNNETGVVLNVPPLASLCRRHGALLHIDAAQAAGRVPIDVSELDCDYLSLSPHKFHGPKGVGILYARADAPRKSLILGHQEFGLRGGTENLLGIVGAEAAVKVLSGWQDHLPGIAKLRDQLEQGILAAVPGSEVNGIGSRRAANTSNIYLPQRDAAELVAGLSRYGVYVSAGAACSTGGEPSHVLRAMGYGVERANSSVRFSLSKLSTSLEIELAIQSVAKVYSATLTLPPKNSEARQIQIN
jgi:cysteine desulfurase